MPGSDSFIMMLLLWTFAGRGVDGENVTGELHGRVELRWRYGHNPDVDYVEWTKHAAENGTKKLLYLVKNPNNATCFYLCQNISFNLQNMSLILDHLTKQDEGIYEEKTVFKNNTIRSFNITLSVQDLSPVASSNMTRTSEEDSGNDTSPQKGFSVPKEILYTVGLSLICLLVLSISFIYLVRRKKNKKASSEEPVYDEPTSYQQEAVTLVVEPLLIVYQDFIKPKDSHQSEDFGYSTIPDVLENIQPS